jgi:predicted transcriptional regulator
MPDTPRIPIIKDQFDKICELLSEGNSVCKSCKLIGISTSSFYRYLDETLNAEKEYTRARSIYVDKRLSDREELNEKCHAEMKRCDPKRVNAIVCYYKELARQIEWELSKLKPKKYGDDLDMGGRGATVQMPPRIEVVIVRPEN